MKMLRELGVKDESHTEQSRSSPSSVGDNIAKRKTGSKVCTTPNVLFTEELSSKDAFKVDFG